MINKTISLSEFFWKWHVYCCHWYWYFLSCCLSPLLHLFFLLFY